MSPLVEQIAQRLELLPESVLRQVLEIIEFLDFSPPVEQLGVNGQPQSPITTDSPNLKQVGHVWVVKATEQAYADGDSSALMVREERIEKLAQW